MKKIISIIATLLVTAIMGGCTGMIKDDQAAVGTQSANAIVADWATLIQRRYPAKTVFRLQGMGDIGTALSKELSRRGYGVVDPEQKTTAHPVLIEVRSGSIGDNDILVMLIINGRMISRSYTTGEKGAVADSAFTEFSTEEKL